MAAGPPFEAGSILVALRASAENLQQEINKANKTLAQFGDSVQKTSTRVAQGSDESTRALARQADQTAKTAQRMASFGQRLLGLQFILQTFSGNLGGTSQEMQKIRESTQGVVAAFSTFAGIITVFPTKIGLAIAAIAALAIIIADLVQKFTQAGAEVQRLEQGLADLEKLRTTRLQTQAEEEARLAQLRLAGVKDVDSAENVLARTQERQRAIAEELGKTEVLRARTVRDRAALEERLRKQIEEFNRLEQLNLSEFGPQFRDLKNELRDNKEFARLTNESTELGVRLAALRFEFETLQFSAGQAVSLKAFTDVADRFSELRRTAFDAQDDLRRGIVTPLQEASAQVSSATAQLELFRGLSQDLQRRTEGFFRIVIDAKQGESVIEALTRRVREAQERAANIQIRVTGEQNIQRLVERFRELTSEVSGIGDRLRVGLITPIQAVEEQLNNARAQLEAFIKLPETEQIKLNVDTTTLLARIRELEAQLRGLQVDIKISEDFNNRVQQAVASFQTLGRQIDDVRTRSLQGFITPLEQARAELNILQQQFLALTQIPPDAGVDLLESLGIEDLDFEFTKVQSEIQQTADLLRLLEIDQAKIDSVRNFRQQFAGIETNIRIIEERLRLGLITPFDAANERATAFRQQLESLLRLQIEVELTPEEEQEVTAQIQTLRDKIQQEQKIELQVEAQARFAEEVAAPFSSAIGSAVRQGILSGASAMETLANVGENLFTTFLDNSIKSFEKGMTDAFTAIAGVGGEALGGLFSGLVGLAGFFLSDRSRGGLRGQSFADVSGGVTSTQAVRGIVAGPESVSIAAVGENLRRALVGVENRLDALIGVAIQIRDSGSFAATGPPGSSFAGAVPTS